MRKFIVSMSYDLSSDTTPQARKMLQAELVGRRWHDRVRDRLMPKNTVWAEKQAEDKETTSDLHRKAAEELKALSEKVSRGGLKIRVTRAWIQVAGGGSYGLAPEGIFDE